LLFKLIRINKALDKLKIKKILTRWDVLAGIAVFIVILLISYFTFFTPNYFAGNSPIQFDIAKGETFSSVVERLLEKGIIHNKTNMKIAGFLYGREKKVRAARFHIPNGLSYLQLLDLFISGKCDFVRKVRVSDGQTINWLGNKLERKVFIDSTEFVELAQDKKFLISLGLKQNSFEGYLFAKEYEIYERSSPEEVLRIFYNEFIDFMNDSLKQRANEMDFTVHEILTMASIVKGETNLKEEMPRIAGVYHNRLRIGMKLQADPTIQYLLEGGWRRLLKNDLEIESPYNTYKYAGLPPGPINNPGETAILASLYPEEHKYLYFVANGNGGHNFSKTYNEHLRNVKAYRKWVREQNVN
jgi:UPF0755 protein